MFISGSEFPDCTDLIRRTSPFSIRNWCWPKPWGCSTSATSWSSRPACPRRSAARPRQVPDAARWTRTCSTRVDLQMKSNQNFETEHLTSLVNCHSISRKFRVKMSCLTKGLRLRWEDKPLFRKTSLIKCCEDWGQDLKRRLVQAFWVTRIYLKLIWTLPPAPLPHKKPWL